MPAIIEAAPSGGMSPFDAARLLLVRGQLERRANRRLAARASLTEALAALRGTRVAAVGGAGARRDRVDGLRHRGPDELTESERTIAELAATGMTNRQVADIAFVSPKTVEANLARVYRKLGIRSRAELGARLATRSGTRDPNRRESPVSRRSGQAIASRSSSQRRTAPDRR